MRSLPVSLRPLEAAALEALLHLTIRSDTRARRLYEALGHRITGVSMRKTLG
ncbi:hypothetical protein [Sorangium sp. So ce131]|uniref:hypothetical protein n=1 Tax=Sorangium sp. So ce131 TaxID=3133282 RepID=UPI003F6131DA